MLKEIFLKEARKIVIFLVSQEEIKDNIIAIYTMGSFAEGIISRKSDIDLNIIVKKAKYNDLYYLRKAIKKTERKFERKIDSNIISKKEIHKDIINSLIFPHKYRHALLIYEIKHYNCLLHGKDVFKRIKINYEELYEETLKLLLTLGYRIRKIYLTGRTLSEAKNQAVKFVVYACKFALINKGIYIYDNDKVEECFLKEFSYLGNLDIVKKCFKILRKKSYISKDIFKRAIDFIERISEERLESYRKSKK